MEDFDNETFEIPEGYLPGPSVRIFWCVFLSLEALFTTLFNLLTIVTFVINPHLRKRSTYGIINLCFADLLVGAVSIPMSVHFLGVVFSFWDFVNFTLELFQQTFYIFTGMSSLFALVLISLERVLATAFPLHHRTTGNLTYVCGIAVTWILAGIVATVWICTFLYAHELQVSLYLWMPALVISLSIVCVSYISVYLAVSRHNSKGKNIKTRSSFQREKELAITLFIVTAISLSCWVPFAVVQILNFNDIFLSINTIYTSIVFANANSFINPIVYVFRMQSFRHALVRLLTKCSRDRGWRKRSKSGISFSVSRRLTANSSLSQVDANI